MLAYVAAARGDFPAAERRCRALLSSTDATVRARAALTLGSVLRQTRRHAEAREIDRRALRAATGESGRAHALIGLAADAVGMGDAAECARKLARAARIAPRSDWRVWVRLRWVRAEHALLTGNCRAAIPQARAALARSRATKAARHEAKSLLFLGVALDACGEPGARAALSRAERIAARIGARPIAAVARERLGARRRRS